MSRLVTDAIVTMGAILLLIFFHDGLVAAVLVGVLGTTALSLIHDLVGERSRLVFIWWSVRYWNSQIRISASYLFRIKVDEKYMLIRGERFPDQFQPVGGVYKMHAEGRSFLKTLDVLDDALLPVDDTSRDDLRIRLKGRHLWSFMKWYDSEVGREADQWREFSEELVRPGILRFETFPHINVERLRRHREFRFSDYAQAQELLIADICELLATPQQAHDLRELLAQAAGDPIRFVSEDEIRRLGFSPKQSQEFRVSATAAWTL